MKRFFLTCLAFAPVLAAFANDDSIGVKNINGRLFIIHEVEKGQGLYGVARRYNVPVDEVRKSNPGVESLEIGQQLLVSSGKTAPSGGPPAPKPSPAPPPNQAQPPRPTGQAPAAPATAAVAKVHTVQPGETLYRIATNHKLTVDELKRMNNLTDNTISVGQELVVSKGVRPQPAAQAPAATRPANIPPSYGTPPNQPVEPYTDPTKHHVDADYASQYEAYRKRVAEQGSKPSTGKIREIKEAGMAASIDDGSIVSNRMLALHKTAPPGTIIKLTNTANGRVLYVKVIAKLQPDSADDNSVIKITKSAADELGARDKYFRVEMLYALEDF